MKKQTAVEWLIKELINYDKLLDGKRKNDDATVFKANPTKIYDQAKAMEKEQIVTTWNTAHQAGRFEGKGIAEENWQTFETYWELTFKSE